MSILDIFKKESSSNVAKDRLKLLLVSDRASCSPEVMEMIKNDIIKVIAKYMERISKCYKKTESVKKKEEMKQLIEKRLQVLL